MKAEAADVIVIANAEVSKEPSQPGIVRLVEHDECRIESQDTAGILHLDGMGVPSRLRL